MAKEMAARRAKRTTVAEEAPESTSRTAKRAVKSDEDYTKYRDKAPTDLQERMADWVIDKVGVEFETEADEDAWRDGLRLGVALRMKFQASPENQAVLAEQKAQREADAEEDEEDEPTKPKRATRKSAAGSRRTKAKPVDEPEEDAEDAEDAEDVEDAEEEAEPEPPKPTRRRAAKPAARKAPATKRTTRRRSAQGSTAPF